MNEIKNEFSWSKSRNEIFNTCPRQYYFNYYGYWGGWEKSAPERTRQIYILKNLKNRYMWAGQTVHQCIKHTLKNLQRGISIIPVDEIISMTINKMRDTQTADATILGFKGCSPLEETSPSIGYFVQTSQTAGGTMPMV